MELDMERWLGGPSDVGVKESKHVYELRGVLLHKGSSAYHGHYEAQVFDPVWVEHARIVQLQLISYQCPKMVPIQ